MLTAENADAQPRIKVPALKTELKDFFDNQQWKLLKKLHYATNDILHSQLPADAVGKIRFVTFSTEETKALFRQIAVTTNMVFDPEDLEIVHPDSDSSGNGTESS